MPVRDWCGCSTTRLVGPTIVLAIACAVASAGAEEYAFEDTRPAFSPDGSKVLFTSTRVPPGEAEGPGGGYPKPYIINVDGTGMECLDPEAGAYPSLSPDGKRVVYSRPKQRGRGCDCVVLDLVTRERVVLTLGEQADLRYGVALPDGRALVVAESYAGSLLIMDPANPTAAPVELGRLYQAGGALDALFLNSDGHIVIIGRKAKWDRLLRDVVVWDPAAEGSEPQRVAQGVEIPTSIAYGPPGKVFVRDLVPLSNERYLIYLAAGAVEPWSPPRSIVLPNGDRHWGTDVGDYAASPDGALLVFSFGVTVEGAGRSRTLYVCNADGSSVRELTPKAAVPAD